MNAQKENGFEKKPTNNYNENKVNQEQIESLLFNEKPSWKEVIYDLINTEQLDPWDIDLILLTNKYLEKIKEMEEANLFISSKVLFAAALLLRIKSEILLNRYLPSLDEILFGKDEEKKYVQEKIELDETIPHLIPRTPLPRHRKVSLQELMEALNKAINTENRRIERVITAKKHEIELAAVIPKKSINIQEQIKEIYKKIKDFFINKKDKIAFSSLVEKKPDKKVETFIPLLYLDTQHKILLEQEKHFDEIWIWLKELHQERELNKPAKKNK